MKIYATSDKLLYGKYQNKTVQEIAMLDCDYIKQLIISDNDFCVAFETALEIKRLNPSFIISKDIISALLYKYKKIYATIKNSTDDIVAYYNKLKEKNANRKYSSFEEDDAYDYFDNYYNYGGCGYSDSCSSCDNYGCNAHPDN